MKNNNYYTTVEQSLRLMKRRLPRESADYFIEEESFRDPETNTWGCRFTDEPRNRGERYPNRETGELIPWKDLAKDISGFTGHSIIPCWSAMRLYEILILCHKDFEPLVVSSDDILDGMCEGAVRMIEKEKLNFHRLKEREKTINGLRQIRKTVRDIQQAMDDDRMKCLK